MLTSNSSVILTTLENIIAPGGRARISPYVESAQFHVLFGKTPEPRKRFDSAQQILSHDANRIEKLAAAWVDFVLAGRVFALHDYTDADFLDAYLVYYFTTNVAKVQLSLLDLVREGVLQGKLEVLDVGVGTGTTLVALLDFLVAWANVCQLYGLSFPVTEVHLTGIDASVGSLRIAERMAEAYAEALQTFYQRQTPASEPAESHLVQAAEWAQAARWQQHDLDVSAFDVRETTLLVACNVLNELQGSGREHLGQMLGQLPIEGMGLVIEPGSKQRAKGLMSWRRHLCNKYANLTSLGACGTTLERTLSPACSLCWNARRESLHQTVLYARFHTVAREWIEDGRRFDDFQNDLLSWSYILLTSNEDEQSQMPSVIPIQAGEEWREGRELTYIGRYRGRLGPVGHDPDEFPAQAHQNWLEYVKFCPAEVGVKQLYLARRSGVQIPSLRYGSSVKVVHVTTSRPRDDYPQMLSLEPTHKTQLVGEAHQVSHQSSFLPHYNERTKQAINEMGYRWFGFPSMRPFQHKILEQVLTGKHILGIAATGSGKSECFILPAMLLPGLTIVVSPLKSLMMDQYDQRIKRRYGLQSLATFINGDVPFNDRQARLKRMELGHYKLIYFTPEQLERAYVLDSLKRANEHIGVRYLAMDEAHCVSQWGHDFRSSYLNLVNRLREWGIHPVRIALTATASPKVREDLCDELDLNPAPLSEEGHLFIESSNRPELNLIVRVCDSTAQKTQLILKDLAALQEENHHDKAPGAAIVFMPYTGGNPNHYNYDAYQGTSRGMLSAGVTHFASFIERALRTKVAIYHGKMEDPPKKELPKVEKEHGDLSDRTHRAEQEAFIDGEREIMVATKGFGMGIDKDNIRLVIHRTPTPNLEAYAQEAGRAGRDGEQANVILYYSPDSPSEDNGYGKHNKFPSDITIQKNFLSNKYVRRSDVVVMRAFLRSLKRQVGDYLYFTNDEAIEFFERCRFQPSLAGLRQRYDWPDFLPRAFTGYESPDHKAILDRGHNYQNKSEYIKRILDVLYRIRPNVDGLGNRLAFLERVQECGATVKGVKVLDGERILASNAYFGQCLRAAELSLAEFEHLLHQPDLLPLAKRLKLSPSETEALLGDIKKSEGYFTTDNKWIPSLLDYLIIVPPCYGPANGHEGLLDAWRNYAGAYKRAYSSTAHERARQAGRPLLPKKDGTFYQSTILNDWFGWGEVNRRMGWEVLPGKAFFADEEFEQYLKTFMALHDERQRNDWAAYHRLLSDYIGVNEDGTRRQQHKKSCLRSVLLGYLKTYDVIIGDNCYSCNRCVPDENFTRVEMSQRLSVIQRMSDATKELLDKAGELVTSWPVDEGESLVEQILQAIREEEAAGRSLRAYVEGWTGRLLQDTPGHLAALWIRSQGMMTGLFELKPNELLENLHELLQKATLPEELENVALLIEQAHAERKSASFCLLHVEVAIKLAQPGREAVAWQALLALIESGHAEADKWAYSVHVGLAKLYTHTAPLANQIAYTKHALLAARSSPSAEEAAEWYSTLIADWEWSQIEAEIAALSQSKEANHSTVPLLLYQWLTERADEPMRQRAIATYLVTTLDNWAEWATTDIELLLQQLDTETLKTYPSIATQGYKLTQEPSLRARLQEAEQAALSPLQRIKSTLKNVRTGAISPRRNQLKVAAGVILVIILVAGVRHKVKADQSR